MVDDGMSINTLDSYHSEGFELYRNEYGRELNNSSEIYVFPADPEEKTRLRVYILPLINNVVSSYLIFPFGFLLKIVKTSSSVQQSEPILQ